MNLGVRACVVQRRSQRSSYNCIADLNKPFCDIGGSHQQCRLRSYSQTWGRIPQARSIECS